MQGSMLGTSWDFKTLGADFDLYTQNTKGKRHFSTKIKGKKSDILKICGCSCTHCTHTNEEPGMNERTDFEKSAPPFTMQRKRPMKRDDGKQITKFLFQVGFFSFFDF